MAEPVPLSGELPAAPPEESTRAAALAVAGAAVLFGTTFLVMKDAVERVDPALFLSVRFLIGAAVLAPFARRRRAASPRATAAAGAVTGAVLALGYVLQTVGLQYTESSVSAFITYLLVVIVPVMSALVLRRRPPPSTLAGLALALVGLVLLTGGGVGLGRGEVLTFGCAVAFAAHIVLLSELAPRHDTTLLNLGQVATVGVVLLPPGLVLGGLGWPLEAWLAAAWTGVAVTAGAFALQVWGQRVLGATRTALILLVEPVAAAALGYAAGERLGWRGTIGAALILAGIAVAEARGALTVARPAGEPGRPA